MVESAFERSARDACGRDLTRNVAAVAARWDAASGHMHVIYYLNEPPGDGDEDLREMTTAELLDSYPAIRTASSAFAAIDDLEPGERRDLVFRRD